MDSNSLAFAAYWRNSLADAVFGQGAFTKKDTQIFSRWSPSDIRNGRLNDDTVKQFFISEPNDVQSVSVILRPQVYLRLIEHGEERTSGAPSVITPLITPAVLSRDGYLYPTSETVIPRDLLEPLAKGTFSIGDIAQFDNWKTVNHVSAIHFYEDVQISNSNSQQTKQEKIERFQKQWQEYQNDCNELLKAVAGDWQGNDHQYERSQNGFIIKKMHPGGTNKHIIAFYDHMLQTKQVPPLFARFASTNIDATEPLLPCGAKFTDRLGHSSDKFPLAVAQRDALSHFLDCQHGEILAVNGPPGTGKTTLVLSVIATLWAKAALAKTAPPVILATSTNNQAVTNIIEAFGKDFSYGTGPLAGRWLPKVKSFGAYYPSSTKKDKADEKYQTETFFNQIESVKFIEYAEEHYLMSAIQAFPGETHFSTETVVELLHQQLQKEVNKLSTLQQSWQKLCQIREKVSQVIGIDPESYIEKKTVIISLLRKHINALKAISDRWLEYRANEPLLYSLFSWFSVVKSKRNFRIQLLLKKLWPEEISQPKWTDINEITKLIDDIITQKQKECNEHQCQLDTAQHIIELEKQAAQDWRKATQVLDYIGDTEPDFSYADELADTQIRFTIFLLTTHYWEGRWLLDMRNIGNIRKEKGKTKRVACISQWQRRMKVTPCVVMTCYMLPTKMIAKQFRNQNPHDDDYLYDFADLLIVDEAGQILPEVAAASFALAKKALVIGDSEQIAPIWNVSGHIDIGNMLAAKIINDNNPEQSMAQYEQLTQYGKTAATGNVMRIAQLATRYQYDPELIRGMYLYEHRRCVDNIIHYCNTLCYHGKLLPKRGIANTDSLFPPMGYLHINGKGVSVNGSSRHNLLEAETIAAWVAANKAKIESHYNKSIHEVIGIVTPFSAQVSILKQVFRKYELNKNSENKITIGTVYSLQGSERQIIIFSPVYSKHEDGGFIDRDNSILNVAVSRAKDSFLVFGDMDLFELQPPIIPGREHTFLTPIESRVMT
ncbi:DNA helicase [Photorhabdus heterorhabditis]|nr:AAA domain-containing protein [Photorhabdus heterorhabditis]MBS9443785.1 DNA helicase [Photorhabdus heterorhabditis]